jgi:hypothetical protein
MSLQIKQIESAFSTLCSMVYANRLKEALNQLSIMMEGMHVADFTLQYEDINQTYLMLLEYNFRGVPDPQRDIIFGKLKVSLLELADKVRQQAFAQTGMLIYQLKDRLRSKKKLPRKKLQKKLIITPSNWNSPGYSMTLICRR